ncbi:34879_t:CDS:2 [Gigaspora margarita]|uniref:34879_t:CDS:1 n=1 Tax=Gigaspora margarita TaxID=4874 RepID=A0ABN7W3T0_GIGMA|nr:34879_t:CDS:2 [Gigaspora margarita]
MSSKKQQLFSELLVSNSLSNSFEDPHLIEDASLYFVQKYRIKLFKKCLLAKTKYMDNAIEKFMIKKYEFGTRQWELKLGNTLQEILVSYWKNKWNEFNKLDFDDPFLNELFSTEDTIELKNDSSFIHQLTNDYASTGRKTKAQVTESFNFVLHLKSAENKSLELFVYEIAGSTYNLKSDKILSDKRKVFQELQDML